MFELFIGVSLVVLYAADRIMKEIREADARRRDDMAHNMTGLYFDPAQVPPRR